MSFHPRKRASSVLVTFAGSSFPRAAVPGSPWNQVGNWRRDSGVTWGGRGRGVPERAWTVWSPRHLTQPEPRVQALSRAFFARDSRLFLDSQSCAPPTHPLPFPGPPQPNSDLRNRFEFSWVEKAFLPGNALLLISGRDGSLCKALFPRGVVSP